ncbi:twin-arginine translocase subunit TatC [Corynebacterium zhongnanshanii]
MNSRRKFRRTKKPKNPKGEMPILEHLEELRRRLLVALAAIAVGTVLGYIWYDTHIGPIPHVGTIPSLGEILRGPYCSLPPEARFGASDGECRLLATGVFEMFVLRFKVGALAGLVFSSPIWLSQIWGFITPGLQKNEKRWTLIVGTVAGTLFMIGAVLAYFVLALGLEFLLTIGDEAQISALNGERYFSFAIGLLLVFGVSFEVPLITVMLNVAGVLSYEQLKEKRRYIIVLLFIFAAFITPGQDPISMVILALSLCLMMEIATQIARLNDKRRKKKAAEWLAVDNESASTIDAASPVTGSSGPVAPAEPVRASSDLSTDDIEPAPAPRSRSGARPQPSKYPDEKPDSGQQGGGSYFDDVL